MAKQKTQEQFINEIKLLHGDKYDLSKIVYRGVFEKIIVICKMSCHGEWKTSANSFRQGSGCPVCAREKSNKSMTKWTTEYFVIEGTKRWDGFFNYAITVCNRSKDMVKFECPVHGIRTQRANTHLIHGCALCEIDKRADEKRITNIAQAERLLKIYGHDFGYENQKIQNYVSVIELHCPEHGPFKQLVQNLLRGTACQKCGQDRTVAPLRITHDEFIIKLSQVHGNKYSLDKTVYVSNRQKVTLTCQEHGDFKISPSNVLKGSGCSRCAEYGFNPGKEAVLYYCRIVASAEKTLYKIGITNKSHKERFIERDLAKMYLVAQFKFDIGQDAYDKEQEIINTFSAYKYLGEKVLRDGNTELFTHDILGLDNAVP
jgi:hypothetical protein